MQAVILVGGEGTRLRPLTYSAPKQMLPIVGKPMLERVLANLERHGVTQAILSLGYLPDRFIASYPSYVVAGMPVAYAVEPEPLDTAGAIRFAAQHGGVDETFVVVNGDILTDLDLSGLLSFHRDRGAEATIALHPVEDPSRYGVVATDGDGRVVAFVEKPPREEAPSNQINSGVYVLEPSVLDYIEPDARESVERVTFPALAAKGSLFALADTAYWLDTGTPQAYLDAHADILNGRRVVALDSPISSGSWVHPSATVGASASLRCATIDRDCHVGNDVTIEDSVLLPGAVVGDGATIRGSILGPRCVIGAHVELNATCVVGADAVVEAGARLEGDVRVDGPSR
jgi:mannose-1-phosphate guanylyltransferase